MVLLDATPLRGPACDRADIADVRGLIGAFRSRPERGRPRLPLAPEGHARALTRCTGAAVMCAWGVVARDG
jgi:hypothetical protein